MCLQQQYVRKYYVLLFLIKYHLYLCRTVLEKRSVRYIFQRRCLGRPIAKDLLASCFLLFVKKLSFLIFYVKGKVILKTFFHIFLVLMLHIFYVVKLRNLPNQGSVSYFKFFFKSYFSLIPFMNSVSFFFESLQTYSPYPPQYPLV